MAKRMTITASGDALIMKRVPGEYPGFGELRAFIGRGDARLTNLETTVTDGKCCPNAYSGGTWLTTDERVLDSLLSYGFNLMGWSNNHTLDYCHEGVLQTRAALNRAGVVHAGAGENLFEASRAGILDTPTGRIGLIAVCSSFNKASVAGQQTPSQPGRPGLNPLGYSEVYTVTPAQLDSLKEVARATGLNVYREMSVAQGFKAPDPEGIFRFGSTLFRAGDAPGVETVPNAADLARVTRMIQDALRTVDYVVVMTHSHEIRHGSDTEPADFLETFSRACIDAGACAVVGGGTHRLKGIEIYRGKPIFYSLGNFLFQNSQVRLLPADFAAQYGMPLDATASECIAARSARSTHSLHGNAAAYQTVVPCMEMHGDALARLTLLPVSLGMHRDDFLHGWPAPAHGEEASAICEELKRISAVYRTDMRLEEDGLIHVSLPDSPIK